VERVVRSISSFLNEFFGGSPNILGDLPQKDRRKIAATMIRYCGLPSVRMSRLSMGTALADLLKTHPLEYTNHFPWAEDRKPTHAHQTVSVCVPTNSASN